VALDFVCFFIETATTERNREYAAQFVEVAEGVTEDVEVALYDPQTSGGFLIAIRGDQGEEFVEKLREKGLNSATIIGKVVSNSDGRIMLRKK